MNGTDFINVAAELANGRTEAHWRSSISRAYYAVFHRAKQALDKQHEYVPTSGYAHKYIREWLQRQSNTSISEIGNHYANLHAARRNADYNFDTSEIIQKNDAMLKLALTRALIDGINKHF